MGPAGPGAGTHHDPRLLRRPGLDLRLRHRQGRAARPGPGGQGAGGRRRCDHTVERPVVPGRGQAVPGSAVGQHGGVQAGTRNPARRQRAGRALRRCRTAQGRPERGPGRAPGRRAPGRPPRGGQGVLHRVDGGRPQDRRGLWGESQEGEPRAGREVGGHPPRRRQSRGVASPDAAQRHHEQRRGVHLADPDPRSSRSLRRGDRGAGGVGAGHEGRRRPRSGHRGGAARGGTAA